MTKAFLRGGHGVGGAGREWNTMAWSRFLYRKGWSQQGPHESDLGMGIHLLCWQSRREAEVIWGREVTWVQSLLTQGGWQDMQEGASQLLPDFWFSLVLSVKSERSKYPVRGASFGPSAGFSSSPCPRARKEPAAQSGGAAGQALNTAGLLQMLRH